MLRLLRSDGHLQEVSDAVRGHLLDDELVCYGDQGQVVASFASSTVFAYGACRSLEIFAVSQLHPGAGPEFLSVNDQAQLQSQRVTDDDVEDVIEAIRRTLA